MDKTSLIRRDLGGENQRSVEKEQTGAARVRAFIEGLSLSSEPERADSALYLRVYRELRDALMAGAVAPGDLLNIRPIATALRVSTMPVREALGRLAGEGALEPLANRAFRIPVMAPDGYRELLLIRLRLEGLAGERAAAHVTTAELAELQDIQAAIVSEAKIPLRRYLSLNRRFHFGIYRAARAPALLEMIELIWLRIGPLLQACQTASDIETAIECHGEMLATLERGDGPAAGGAVQLDLLRANKTIIAYLASTSGSGHGSAGTKPRSAQPAAALLRDAEPRSS